MHYTYPTSGTCSRAVEFDIDDEGIVTGVRFAGGCPGNTLGVATLAEGRQAEELIAQLRGIPCRDKATSCPDQLARALADALSSHK